MVDPERERLSRLTQEAARLVWHPPAFASVDQGRRIYRRFERRMQNLRNLDALIELDAETADDILREAYP